MGGSYTLSFSTKGGSLLQATFIFLQTSSIKVRARKGTNKRKTYKRVNKTKKVVYKYQGNKGRMKVFNKLKIKWAQGVGCQPYGLPCKARGGKRYINNIEKS